MRGGSGPGTAVAEPPVGARWFVPTSGAMFEAGRSWFKTPVVACYLNPEWRNVRMASLLVVRGLGGMVYGHAYLVDLLGAGLRDCYPIGAMSLRTFEKTVLKTFTDRLGGVDTCTLLDAANLVWGGLAVARDRGFSVPPCADGCARAAGERPSDERLDLSIFESAAPDTARLPSLSATRELWSGSRMYRVTEAEAERRPVARVRDARAFAAFYGGNTDRYPRAEGLQIAMPLYTEEDLEESRLRARGLDGIDCRSRVTYDHSDSDDVLERLFEWMDLRIVDDASEDRIELSWHRENPARRGPLSLLRSKQTIGELVVTPMKLMLETRSRELLYAGRIWIENSLPGLTPIEFSYADELP